jgi:hypothetical protein
MLGFPSKFSVIRSSPTAASSHRSFKPFWVNARFTVFVCINLLNFSSHIWSNCSIITIYTLNSTTFAKQTINRLYTVKEQMKFSNSLLLNVPETEISFEFSDSVISKEIWTSKEIGMTFSWALSEFISGTSRDRFERMSDQFKGEFIEMILSLLD